MDTLYSHSSSAVNTMDLDVSVLMDTSQDFEPSPDGVVRWVASQSPNPALQALMKEAERERRTRPSTPVQEPMSWTYPLTSTSSSTSTSLSTSVASPWQSSGHNSADASYPLPLSGSSSSSSLAPRASEPSVPRRVKPVSAAQRKPLASSFSSTNQPLASSASSAKQPLRDTARPRSSSHSTALSNPCTSKLKYIPQEEEPEAMAFIELLKDVSRQLDQNAEKKQRLAARAKEEDRERSLGRSSIDTRTGLDTSKLNARPLTKTSSASAIHRVASSTRPVEKPSSSPVSAFRPESRGRMLAKTASLGAPNVDLVSGKSTPASLPNLNLNCELQLAPSRMSKSLTMHPTAVRKAGTQQSTSDNGDSAMQDVIDLTETDTEWERPISGPMSRKDTTYMQVDDDDMYNDTAMDVSFFQADPPPQNCIAAPKSIPHPPQPNTASRPPAPTQRTRTGPPPLGMRRPSQLQATQYSSSQGSKGVTVPRFKPPLLANATRSMNKSGSGTKLATTTSSRPPPRGGATKATAVEMVARGCEDADSSFDVSFEMDADALEEAMKAYD
ncbi:hypothetical protein J3R83DRAFT_4915 [Lanmaoa asiatica]|nr:hypothetical protein J3R83DRAFT_4915 [Lanmaoa asiatica]